MFQPGPCLTSTPPHAAQRTFDLLLLIGVRLLVSGLVWWSGFRAVSDDDYARVVIAQKFASAPALDPSGTSWLPFPFWVQGSAMGLLGTELRTAVGVAWVSGVASTLLVWLAARTLGLARGPACIAAALASAIAYSAWLGVATVPELLTAALVTYGAATLAVPDARQRSWGALALCCATLSRYETWPVGVVFAAFCLRDAQRVLRSHNTQPTSASGMPGFVSTRPRSKHEARLLAAAALTASAGMLLWLLHGVVKHDSATFFVERVARYQSALGGPTVDVWTALTRHPSFVVEHAPTLVGVAVLGAALGAALTRFGFGERGSGERPPTPLTRPLLACASVVIFLIAGDLRGAGATHHPARTLLPVWFFACIVVTATWGTVFMRFARQRVLGQRTLGQPPLAERDHERRAAWLTHTALALVALTIVVADGLHNGVLDGTRGFVDRSDELQIGAHARRLIVGPPHGEAHPGASDGASDGANNGASNRANNRANNRASNGTLGGRVLVAAEDFGYFAMIAAIEDPARVDVFDDRDPRRSSTSTARQENLFDRAEVLQQKLEVGRVTVIIAPQSAIIAPQSAPETLRLLGLQNVTTASTKYALLAVTRQP